MKTTILACRPCRLEGHRFTAPHTPAGDRRMDEHWTTEHPDVVTS